MACGVGAVAAMFWLGQAPDHRLGVTEPTSEVHAETPLAAGFEHDLASSGISYTVVGDPTDQASDVRESVFDEFGSILDEGGTPVVIRVRFTDRAFGHVDDPDAPNPTLTPYFTDREAFMVVLAHQTMPVSHPPAVNLPKGVDADLPEVMEGTFVAFVDLKRFEVLRAVSWGY